jgi:hypothetical protein
MVKSVMVRLKLAGKLFAPELAWTLTLVLAKELQPTAGYRKSVEEFVPHAWSSSLDKEKL